MSSSAKPVVVREDSFNKFLKFLEITNGRDKIARLIQYFSRFLSWWIVTKNPDWSKKFSNLESSSSNARKLFRLAKSLSHFQNALKAYIDEKDPFLRITNIVQSLSLAGWLLYDHLIFSHKIGFVQFANIQTYSKRCNTLWLVAMLAGIVKCLHLLNTQQQLLAERKSQDAVESIKKRQKETAIELARNVFDLPIPLTNLSTTVASAIPSGIVGLSGTLTSLIGIYQVWNK